MTTRCMIIDHVNINVRDLEARQLYQAALMPLGLEELPDPHGGITNPEGNGGEAVQCPRSAKDGDR